MNILELYQHYLAHQLVTTDTRNIPKNSIFFALKGERFNGNQFAKEAIQKGAKMAIVDEPEYESESNRIVLVPDALLALQELAKHHRKQLKIPIIGLTGSNGKTTSKELMASVFSQQLNTSFTLGNLNNHIGVPLTILSIKPSHQMAIVEMGANHQKEIEFLSNICQPDIGYITNFGKAHLEGFGGVEGVIKGKSELYDFLRQRNKQVLLNMEDAKQVEKASGIQAITFGVNQGEYRFKLIESSNARVAVEFNHTKIQTKLTGNYNFSNICAAIALGLYFGIDLIKIKQGIEQYSPTNNRSQIKPMGNSKLILDAYNANPSSMQVALQNLSKLDGEKTAILGDMFELGDAALEEHQHILNVAEELQIECIGVGEIFSQCKTQTSKLFKDKQQAEDFLQSQWQAKESILIKASRGMKFESFEPILQKILLEKGSEDPQ